MSSPGYAKDLITVDKALKKMFRKASGFDERIISLGTDQIAELEDKARISINGMHASSVIKYTVRNDKGVLGYAYEDTVVGKWGPIHYLVGVSPQGAVLDTIILDYQEIRGKPIAKRRFLRQYKGKTLEDPLKLRRDIDGVTGATISSRSLTDGIRKILHIHEMGNL